MSKGMDPAEMGGPELEQRERKWGADDTAATQQPAMRLSGLLALPLYCTAAQALTSSQGLYCERAPHRGTAEREREEGWKEAGADEHVMEAKKMERLEEIDQKNSTFVCSRFPQITRCQFV